MAFKLPAKQAFCDIRVTLLCILISKQIVSSLLLSVPLSTCRYWMITGNTGTPKLCSITQCSLLLNKPPSQRSWTWITVTWVSWVPPGDKSHCRPPKELTCLSCNIYLDTITVKTLFYLSNCNCLPSNTVSDSTSGDVYAETLMEHTTHQHLKERCICRYILTGQHIALFFHCYKNLISLQRLITKCYTVMDFYK